MPLAQLFTFDPPIPVVDGVIVWVLVGFLVGPKPGFNKQPSGPAVDSAETGLLRKSVVSTPERYPLLIL